MRPTMSYKETLGETPHDHEVTPVFLSPVLSSVFCLCLYLLSPVSCLLSPVSISYLLSPVSAPCPLSPVSFHPINIKEGVIAPAPAQSQCLTFCSSVRQTMTMHHLLQRAFDSAVSSKLHLNNFEPERGSELLSEAALLCRYCRRFKPS